MPEQTLTEAFLSACSPEIAAELGDDEALAEVLSGHVAAAREALPNVRLDANAFVVHMGGRMHGDVDARKCVRAVFAADLYLAKACADGDRYALDRLEKELARLPAAVSRAAKHAPLDEVFQALRA